MDAARKDFIVLSEFSEQVGPDPVVREGDGMICCVLAASPHSWSLPREESACILASYAACVSSRDCVRVFEALALGVDAGQIVSKVALSTEQCKYGAAILYSVLCIAGVFDHDRTREFLKL